MMILLLILSVIYLSHGVNLSPCEEIKGYGVFCTEISNPTITPDYFQSFQHIATSASRSPYMHLIKRQEIYYAKPACKLSASRSFNFKSLNGIEQSIILMETLECSMTGNIMGSIYEMFAYAMEKQIAFGRLKNPSKHCGENTIADVLRHLPVLFIPSQQINASFEDATKIGRHDSGKCDSIYIWPWESSEAHMWRQYPLIAHLQATMVQRYVQSLSHQPEKHRLYTTDLEDTIALHFRCGDNLKHTNMGLLSMAMYRDLFNHLLLATTTPTSSSSSSSTEKKKKKKLPTKHRVLIYTDTQRDNSEHGEICSQALNQLETFIQHEYSHSISTVKVMWQSSALDAFVSLQQAKKVICSISTFCFFAAMGQFLPNTTETHSSNSTTVKTSKILIMPVGENFAVGLPNRKEPFPGVITVTGRFFRPMGNTTETFLKILATADK
jgi:hypothetical protein